MPSSTAAASASGPSTTSSPTPWTGRAGCAAAGRKLGGKRERSKKRSKGQCLSRKLALARQAEAKAVALARDVRILSDLLRFFLNHRRFLRTDRPERVGKSPRELLTGRTHPHWLELLGHERFDRNGSAQAPSPAVPHRRPPHKEGTLDPPKVSPTNGPF